MSLKIYIKDGPLDQFGQDLQANLNGNGWKYSLGVFATSLNYIAPTATQLKQVFVDNGWIVDDLWHFDWNPPEASTGSLWDLLISFNVNVYSKFSAEDVQQGAAAVLSKYFDVHNIYAIPVVPVQIPGSSTSTSTSSQTINPGKKKTTPSDPYSYIPNLTSPTGTDFFSSLGSSLGISTPIVLAGLLVLTIVVLKR